jgi:hypothetical protein
MIFRDLTGDQTRQHVNAEQVFSVYRDARRELEQRYNGSMFWRELSGQRYLYRKVADIAKSLGPENDETREAYNRFTTGREKLQIRMKSLSAQLDRLAPVNRAMGLSRVPLITAKILRNLDFAGLLGSSVRLAGTNAMFAYERQAGVHFGTEHLATDDVDLLFDARRRARFIVREDAREGLIGVLKRADRTFERTSENSFRAANSKGFMVDLIKPATKNPGFDRSATRIGKADEDLTAIDIEGLTWLANSPLAEVIVIDDEGYPVSMSAPDPRAFALHKLWLSERDDRDPAKRRRDRAQAEAVAGLVVERLPHLSFAGRDIEALPAPLRDRASALFGGNEEQGQSTEPRW